MKRLILFVDFPPAFIKEVKLALETLVKNDVFSAEKYGKTRHKMKCFQRWKHQCFTKTSKFCKEMLYILCGLKFAGSLLAFHGGNAHFRKIFHWGKLFSWSKIFASLLIYTIQVDIFYFFLGKNKNHVILTTKQTSWSEEEVGGSPWRL